MDKKKYFAAFVGNFLEHYDHALYGLLAPFLATYFFPKTDFVSSLIWIYSLYPLGVITRFLGAWVFGSIGDKRGREVALSLTLLGTAIVTTLMGLLPTYRQVGILAPIFLLSSRLVQNFFSSSETMGGAVFLFEKNPSLKKNILSSLYDMSSMAGIFLASFLISLFVRFDVIDMYWRTLFIGASITAWMGVYVRRFKSMQEQRPSTEEKVDLLTFFTLVVVSSLSYVIYNIAFVLMNGLLPLISNISQAQTFEMNTLFLLGDFLLLPIFGWICTRYTKEKIMAYAIFGVLFLSLPLFHWVQGASILIAYFIRFTWVLLGVALSAPFYVWAVEIIGAKHRFKQVILAHVIGSQLLGKSFPVIGFWLFKKTGWTVMLGCYPMLIAGISLGLFLYHQWRLTTQLDIKPFLEKGL